LLFTEEVKAATGAKKRGVQRGEGEKDSQIPRKPIEANWGTANAWLRSKAMKVAREDDRITVKLKV